MACLNKLAIRGIRSFDDKQISVIEFFSPVTVIVGHNGSGKTTIIECLKYATTGDQPPNSRGGAFIHDPKMANEKEVKAQVKLRFHAANGTRMLCVRNLSLTVKKTGMTMKTLEGILGLADETSGSNKKRGVISTKCAEIDAEIPQLLGVSKAVLENVIFCHQEDSYWPLAEASTLKKKFDDIFEATRYTKALNSIKDLRKERVADLKAESARLELLARDKGQADKLKSRIADLNVTVGTKEVEYENTKKEYDALVTANQKFYDYATKFREMYVKIESLQEQQKLYQDQLAEARLNLQEIPGTDEELDGRLQNFNEHIATQKEKARTEEIRKQDLEEELSQARKVLSDVLQEQGALRGQAELQQTRIADREELICTIAKQHDIRGFDSRPLEREKVVEFVSKLSDLQRKQKSQLEKLQSDIRVRTEEYNNSLRDLSKKLEGHKLQKTHLRDNIAKNQSSINTAEKSLEASDSVQSELRALVAELEEKRSRLSKTKTTIQSANYEVRLAEKTAKSKGLEDQRDTLNAEFRILNMQADSRAKLDLKRSELRTKTGELKNTLDTANIKFRKLVGTDARPDTIDREVDRVLADKEREHAEQENRVSAAGKALQAAEAALSTSKTQFKAKRDELKALERKMKVELEHDSLEAAIKEAAEELSHRKQTTGTILGSKTIYENLLKVGQQKKVCSACNRHLNDRELVVFEQYINEQMNKTSPDKISMNKEEMEEWETELNRLQELRPVESSRNRVKNDELPALEAKIKEQEAAIPPLAKDADEASSTLSDIKRELKDIAHLRDHANTISRLQREQEHLKTDIGRLEEELSATGSTKTPEDVQSEIDSISSDIRLNEREKQSLLSERERHQTTTRTIETDIHSMQLREKDLESRIRENSSLEDRIKLMKHEIATFNTQLKATEALIDEAQAPIDLHEQEYRKAESDLSSKLSMAQQHVQALNISEDKLNRSNKEIEQYVREKRAKRLQDCTERAEELAKDIEDLASQGDKIREVINRINREISESGASMANLRENIRARKLIVSISDTQKEIDSFDMEEAARARRNFKDKYEVSKAKENELQTTFSHIAGEISSHKAQLRTWEDDLKEFENINKKYMAQLIKVKMSDMANNDLEKYAKALDNAIMKYHTLKMEEVNDTMRHLWNKTYQGTDIDGIKIRSDVEDGSTKRSYNYRVVMTKDQVEMDMRGRCSAGQKMLASIIIRLALSDSFGQNCGILALDEPTNALDTENIDALAASLVDIINERKNHSNFQLIIITHDENFLRKLGQSDVMEYYWRVSRDSRQKSAIERQRFR
ncbi:hypothetical protein HGRIS_006124 [Hohenbuehelia grisea]|uniref:Rad50/SbcC-type AAA domain-containing protein n=1 Tax=Hohenbuehelia grisea TaxID=104357 RepID=A0ABR3JZ84_9AGAR